MAGGEHYGIALDSRGSIWSWGRNASRTLGRETELSKSYKNIYEMEPYPSRYAKKIYNIPKIKKISAKESHWFALTINGELLVFGLNSSYKTGLGLRIGETSGNIVFDSRNMDNVKYIIVNKN